MPQSLISVFVDDNAVAEMIARVPLAVDFNSGMFAGASNSPGIGISTENPGLEESLLPGTDGNALSTTGSWTLLDQHGDARNAQIGQLIGGSGVTLESDWPGSGGLEGTSPDATIRLIDAADLPTYAQKLADSTLDGNVTLPAPGASLVDLATGWAEQV